MFFLPKFLGLVNVTLNFVGANGATVAVISFFVSNLNILIITFDRVCATIMPFKYKTRATIKRSLIVVSIVWPKAL